MEQSTNTVTLRGSLQELPRFSHENHKKRFFRFTLEVPRLSGTVDYLPIIAEEAIINSIDPTAGDMLTVTGQIRSRNHRTDGVRHLMIFVFASTITAECAEPLNEVELTGFVCRTPNFRRTPLGREICDVILAVPRAFRRADYLPCIFWGRTAQEVAASQVRDSIHICGRLQSRNYTKQTPDGPMENIAYEISALTADVWPAEEQ